MSEPVVVVLPGTTAAPFVVTPQPDPLTGATVIEVGSGDVEHSTLDNLADVDTTGATSGQVLVRGDDGVWRAKKPPPSPPDWGDQVRFSATQPDPATAPDNAVWVHLGPDMKIFRKGP